MDDSELVRFMYWTQTEQAILGKHVADHTGHCGGCTWIEAAQPVSPCDLRLAALRVVTLRASDQTPAPCSPDPEP